MTDRLHSGIKASEAVRLASIWWDDKGRYLVNAHANQEEVNRRFRSASNGAPAIITPGERQAVINSGILNGWPWDRLTRREQQQVVKQWHEFVFIPARGEQTDETKDTAKRLRLDA